jgi:hypothetical protein
MENPMEVYQRAMGLLQNGGYAEALRDFVWLQENSVKFAPDYQSLRRTYALAGWIELAKIFAPARQALDELQNSLICRQADAPEDKEAADDLAALQSRYHRLNS